jgi:hypothetical protein
MAVAAPVPGAMPAGNVISLPIRQSQVQLTPGGEHPPAFNDDAAATLVWQDFQRARNYVEQNLWLLEWQHTDILYQSPTLDRYPRVENGARSPRISRFLVAKNTNTMKRQVKRAIFAEQVPFFLRPNKDTTQFTVDAWTALLMKLLQRMNFQYNTGLLIDTQVLQGTGIGKAFWDTRKVLRKYRKPRVAPDRIPQQMGPDQIIHTPESDSWDVEEEWVEESWPCFEYRKLGTTLFDAKCCTPNRPDLSGNFCIDYDYVTLADLVQLRQLECYKNIPDEATLRSYFFDRSPQSAPAGTQVEQNFSAQGSPVTHAQERRDQTSEDPTLKPMMMIERWDDRQVMTILYYDGRKLTIRNEEHDNTCIHVTANWWNIDNCLYGMGCGRIGGPDQRINQGILNECLKLIAYPMNAPLLIASGLNAPTQNVIQRLGGFWQVEGLPPGADLNKAVRFLETPEVPADAWHMLEVSQQSGEDITGANAPFMQGNLPGPGSSAARTATGAQRIASKADENIADPVEAVSEGVVVRVVYWLIEMVKEFMPLWEIREILSEKYAKAIEDEAFMGKFLNAEFEVSVLAGQKLAVRQGIQQILPFFMQVVQQPQLLEFLHQRGDTIDFATIVDLFMQVADLANQPDIIRPLSAQEKQTMAAMNPQVQKNANAMQVEQLRGQNKIAEIHEKAKDDLATSLTEKAMEHVQEGVPLTRSMALAERGADTQILREGMTPQ